MARGAVARLVGRVAGRRAYGSGPPGGFWSEGTQKPGQLNGYIFGETPPAAGQSRKWEGWELPWYLGFGTGAVVLAVGLNAKPETSIQKWAAEQAKESA